jgi:DNA replication and repair protein RecF
MIGSLVTGGQLVAGDVQGAAVLLLDEVAAHLDPLRRANLFDRLSAMQAQVWMTGTEPSLFSEAPAVATRYTVRDGAVLA